MSRWIPFGSAFQFPLATQTPLLLWDATCPPQLRPGAIRKLLPGCCGDVLTAAKIQLFQQGRLTQRLKQICGSICTLHFFVEAPAFCHNQPVESTLGLGQSKGTITYPGQLRLTRQLHHSDDAPKLEQLPTETNKYIYVETRKPSTSSFNHFWLRGTIWNLPFSSGAT